MSIVFFEGRSPPSELTGRMDGYGNTGDDIANIVEKASPFDFLKGVFVDKPIAQANAQAALAATQASTAIAMQQEADLQKQATMRTLTMVGAGLAGLMVFALVLRPHPRAAPAVAGYRRKSRRSKRSR